MSYIEKQVTLSKAQVASLIKGKSVRLTYDHLLDGPHKIFLTPREYGKVQTHLRKQKGMVIGPLSTEQLDHLAQHGGDIWSTISNLGKSTYRNAIKPAAEVVYNQAIKPLANAAKDEAISFAKDQAKDMAIDYAKNTLLPAAKAYMKGSSGGSIELIGDYDVIDVSPVSTAGTMNAAPVARKTRGRKAKAQVQQHGEGFLDDLWGGVKDAVGVVAPIAQTVAPYAPLLMAAAGVKKRSARKASSKQKMKGGMVGYQKAGSFKLP